METKFSHLDFKSHMFKLGIYSSLSQNSICKILIFKRGGFTCILWLNPTLSS